MSSHLDAVRDKNENRHSGDDDDDEGGENDGSKANVLQRHKKEKKDLQTVITAMKHKSKNDRSKKKEVANEIARLEADLANKHAQELEEFDKQMKLEHNDVAAEEISSNSTVAPAVDGQDDALQDEDAADSFGATKKASKAQKRRDKKEAKAKETERLVAESMQEAKKGVRYKEEQSFKAVLAKKGLALHCIPADGDCLFNAVAHQLSLRGLSTRNMELREQAASIMQSNRDDYLPFLTSHTGDSLPADSLDDYCAKLQNPGVWGGQPELVALSTFHKRPIEVLQADGLPILIGEQYAGQAEPLVITYHRHAFRLGEHYNSTEPAAGDRGDDNDDDR